MAVSEQTDFGVGIYRGRKAPAGSVFDAVNGLVDDEGQIFRRGGSAYLTTADAGAALLGLADLNLPLTGDVTLAWTSATLYRVNGSAFALVGTVALKPWTRGVALGQFWYAPTSGNVVFSTNGNSAGTTTYAVASAIEFVGSIGGRLLFGDGTVVWFTPIDATTVAATDFHQFPGRARVIGIDGIGTSAIVFTTAGVWAIDNMELDPVDDAGNVQHVVRQISKDIVLWGDPGVSAWAGGLVVPAVDDVRFLGLDGQSRPISESIRPLYRSYVAAGYQPGIATVHRGHYKLPILNGNTWVDTLVCRLDRPFQTPGGRVFYPWTRWAGHAAGGAYAQRVGSSTRTPKLFSVSGQRVLDLTACMSNPGAASDADASTPTFTVIGSDADLGPGIRPNTAEKVRFTYEAAGSSPAVTVSTAVGLESASFTAAVLKRGGGASDGTDYSAWRVGRKAERIRWKFECSSAVTSLLLRRAEWTIRQSGQS